MTFNFKFLNIHWFGATPSAAVFLISYKYFTGFDPRYQVIIIYYSTMHSGLIGSHITLKEDMVSRTLEDIYLTAFN